MPTQLTTHFTREEFEKSSHMPEECVSAYRMLCEDILEPVREQFGAVIITSGYRSSVANQMTSGKANSQHVATSEYCAADFYCDKALARTVFDWIRHNPALMWDQLIYEQGEGIEVIHVSWRKPSRRVAYEGATHNAMPYTAVSVAPFKPESA